MSALSIQFDTTNIKTGRPVIANSHECRVRCFAAKEESNENGAFLFVELHLLDPAPTTEGGSVNPGFSIIDRIYFYDKNKPGVIPEMSQQKVCALFDAFFGTGDAGNRKNRPARPAYSEETLTSLIGREAMIKVKVKTGDYEGNEVAKYINPEDRKA